MTGAQYLMTGAKCEYFWCPVYNTYRDTCVSKNRFCREVTIHDLNYMVLISKDENRKVFKEGRICYLLSRRSLRTAQNAKDSIENTTLFV